MPEPQDAYTVVVFRGAKASPWRLSFPRKVVKWGGIVVGVLALSQVVLFSQYLVKSWQVWELQQMKEEMVTAREQATAFSASLDDLKKRFVAMKEVNQRLRVMLGIESPVPEDYLNGKGGEETPIAFDDDGAASGKAAEQTQVHQGGEISATASGDVQKNGDQAAHLKQELARLLQEFEAQERSLAEIEAAASESVERRAALPSINPVSTGWVTSGFGPRVSPFTGQLAMHDGLDIGANPQEPIRAPGGGVVVAVASDERLGNLIVIDHGYGYETEYGHMAKALVRVGQKVKRGDVVGLVGSTGHSTGPHLHYIVKVSGHRVNPKRYILD